MFSFLINIFHPFLFYYFKCSFSCSQTGDVDLWLRRPKWITNISSNWIWDVSCCSQDHCRWLLEEWDESPIYLYNCRELSSATRELFSSYDKKMKRSQRCCNECSNMVWEGIILSSELVNLVRKVELQLRYWVYRIEESSARKSSFMSKNNLNRFKFPLLNY